MEKKYPFKFLKSYDQNDVDIFFGRDEEIDALYEMAFQNSILLVYGASGTGKTSLIQCGLASRFKSYDWLALMIRRGTNINESLEKILMENGGNNLPEKANPAKNLSGLQRLIKGVYLTSFKPVYLIFDQFEELYILGTKDEQEKFIESVKEIQNSEQPVKMIFSIREEYLGYLYEFEKEVPHLLRKKLRVEPMTIDKVKNVMEGINNYELSNVKIKEDEIDAITKGVFERLKGKKKTLTIQLPYLQVFLDKLYIESTGDENRQADASISMEVLNRIGDIGDVLRNFLEEQVKAISQKISVNNKNVNPETIWKILSPFSTLEGTKEPISKKELAERLTQLDPKLIDEAVESFVNSRILYFNEGSNLYELAHDSLALRIAEKRTDEDIALLEVRKLIKNRVQTKGNVREFFTKKELNFIEPYEKKLSLDKDEIAWLTQSREADLMAETKKKAKRKKIFISIAGTTILVIAVLAWFLIQARIAKNENTVLLANTYWNNSKSKKAESDYGYALAQAFKAFSLSKDKGFKENILMEIESKWPSVILKNIISAKSQIVSAAFSDDTIITISKDLVIRWTSLSGDSLTEKRFLSKDKVASVLQFTPDGKNILTLDTSDSLNIWDIKKEKRLNNDSIRIRPSRYFLPITNYDGTMILIYEDDKGLSCYRTADFTKPIFSIKELPRFAQFSPEGKQILIQNFSDNAISIIDIVNKSKPVPIVLYSPRYNQEKYDKLIREGKDFKTKDFYDNIKYDHPLKSICFSPNGVFILTASIDSTIRIWNRDGMQLGDSLKHQFPVENAIFSPDDQKILSIDAENSTHIWDAESRKKIGHSFKLEPGWYLNPPVFSPDGNQILTIINGTALIWQLVQKSDADDAELDYGNVKNRFFSPDLKKIVEINNIVGYNNYKILDAETGKSRGKDIKTDLPFNEINNKENVWFSPDGKRIITRQYEDSIQLWNADFATRIGPLIPFSQSGELIFSPVSKEPDGDKKRLTNKKLIIKYENDSNFKFQIWNAENGKKTGNEIIINKTKYNSVQNLSVPNTNQEAQVSSMNLYNEHQVINDPLKPVFSADGNWVLILFHSDDSVFYELYDANTSELKGPKHSLLFPKSPFFWYPFLSPDGKFILSPINDSTAQMLKAETGKRQGELIHHHPGWQPQYSPDGKWILFCASDSTAQFVDAETGRKKGNTIKHVNSFTVPLINKDGTRVLTMQDYETFYLWNTETQKQIKQEFIHEAYSLMPAFSPDGKMFLTSDNFGNVRLFDAETGNQKGPALKHPKSEVQEFVFSDNSKKILIVNLKYAGTDKAEYSGTIWNAATGKQSGQEIKDLLPNNADVNEKEVKELRFSDDGRFLLYQPATYGDLFFLNTEAGDLDIPEDLLELQILMTSGYRYDFAIDENISITSKEFYGEAGIMKKYYDKAKKHYAVCKYTKHNLWKRFHEEEAKNMRPDDFKENSKTESAASQFEILPGFQKGDSTIKENNGSFLEPNQAITSKNKKYMLAYQADGNLVIYRKEDMASIWATDTYGYPAYRTIMQFDGNLVIYSGSPKERGDQAIWASNTWENNANAYLVLEDNGNLVIYNTKNEIVWQSYSIDEVETKKSK